MPIIDEMAKLGFSEKESALYLALAESGKTTATSLARKTKLSRSSVYFVLEALKTRGLVVAETKNKTTLFTAQHPSALGEEIRKERDGLKEKLQFAERLAEDLLPYFRSKQFHVPKLQFFEGRNAVKETLSRQEDRWHGSMLERDCTWWGFEDGSLWEQYRPWFEHLWKKFRTVREEKLNVRVFTNVPISDFLESKFPRTKLRPLPTGYKFSTTLWLMGDYVALISTREKPHYLYQLEDPALAENLRVIFRLLWRDGS